MSECNQAGISTSPQRLAQSGKSCGRYKESPKWRLRGQMLQQVRNCEACAKKCDQIDNGEGAHVTGNPFKRTRRQQGHAQSQQREDSQEGKCAGKNNRQPMHGCELDKEKKFALRGCNYCGKQNARGGIDVYGD